MSLYISNRQVARLDLESLPLSLLLLSPYLDMQHRAFPKEFRFSSLLQDAYELSNTGSDEKLYYLLPTTSVSLIFLLGSRTSGAVACGPLTSIRSLPVAAGAKAFYIHLNPGSGDWLIDGGVSQLTDKSVPLSLYLGGTERLLFHLRRGESFHERVVLFCRMLDARNAGTYQPMALVRRCVDLIGSRCGMIRVSELAGIVGCSERYLNRIFQDRVGISTKLCAEIVQFQCSLRTILTTHPKSLLDIAVAYGYFDQAHMNRFYRKFLNCTAGDIRCSDGSAIVSGHVPSILPF